MSSETTIGGRMGTWRTFALGAAVALLLIPILAPPASAHPDQYCWSTEQGAASWNTEGTDSAQKGNHTGIKSLVHFDQYGGLGGGGDCIRVSSVAVINNSGGFAEIGWYLGWDTSNNNQYTGQDACLDGVYYGAGVHPYPEIFVVWQPNGGQYHCKNIKADGQDVWHYLRIQDSDQDTEFKYYEAGTFFGSVSVNFDRGVAITNGERKNTLDDTAQAHFKDLQKNVAGLPSLYPFTTSVEYVVLNNDPDFHWQFVSDVETRVNHD